MSEFTLGGVVLEVIDPMVLPPAQPNEDPALNWSADILTIGTQIRMANGSLWRLWTFPVLGEDARYTVVLRKPGTTQRQTFLVPAGEGANQIWNVGLPRPEPEPEPEPEIPIVVIPPPDVPPAVPGDPPPPVIPPVEDPEIPVEPPVDPLP